MTLPTRIQRKRTRGYRSPPGTVYCGRPTRWGNPFPVGIGDVKLTIEQSLSYYRQWLLHMLWRDPTFLDPLRTAKHLSCWCGLDAACHVDVLLEVMREQCK